MKYIIGFLLIPFYIAGFVFQKIANAFEHGRTDAL